ncbi:MAG: efflux RND transporter periplasmic adaptor subunit [Kordiimonadaceae bacterium]|nr:efflux RND transporter periplasmic adaptor subunit [Kordiimonadaceae bacterium]
MKDILNFRLFSLMAMFGLGLSACEEKPQDKPEVSRPVKLLTTTSPEAGSILEYSGVISASRSTKIGFEVAGQIIDFPIREGEQVLQGQILAALDSRDYKADMDSAAARLEAATADFNRYQQLLKDGWVSQQRFEKEKLTFEAADANFRSARKAFEDATLIAPYSGVIAQKIVDDFENVRAKQPILELNDIASLQIIVNVPERDLIFAYFNVSLETATKRAKPTIIVSSLPDIKIPAYFKELELTSNPTTRTFAVTLAFLPSGDHNILPGMTARVAIHSRHGNTGKVSLHVPASAVVANMDGSSSLWLFDEETMTVHQVPIKIGQFLGQEIEILSGIHPGQTVVISGVSQLRSGMKVHPLNKQE